MLWRRIRAEASGHSGRAASARRAGVRRSPFKTGRRRDWRVYSGCNGAGTTSWSSARAHRKLDGLARPDCRLAARWCIGPDHRAPVSPAPRISRIMPNLRTFCGFARFPPVGLAGSSYRGVTAAGAETPTDCVSPLNALAHGVRWAYSHPSRCQQQLTSHRRATPLSRGIRQLALRAFVPVAAASGPDWPKPSGVRPYRAR